MPAVKRFVMTMNRFAWEAKSGLFRQHNERRKACCISTGCWAPRPAALPATSRTRCCRCWRSASSPLDKPAGIVELIFSGGGAIMLDVECIEARLADLGGAWEATSRPFHRA